MDAVYQSDVALAVVSGALIALTLLLALAKTARVDAAKPKLSDDPENISFIFSRTGLIDATPRALEYLGTSVSNKTALKTLNRKLTAFAPEKLAALSSLYKSTKSSALDLPTERGHVTVNTHRDKRHHHISLQISNAVPSRSEEEATKQQMTSDELQTLRDATNLSPVLTWEEDPNGEIIWANSAYFDVLDLVSADVEAITWPLPHIFADFPPAESTQNKKMRRVSVEIAEQDTLWFQAYEFQKENGARLFHAIHANPLVKAEEALRNFVQTLTKTFAHLPIGLAIFDRNRQLALFNPALADLTTLSPVWLSERPTLYAFLDRLRETRQMPEPRNYKSWREEIAELEEGALNGSYEQNWPLPSGHTYKVTGRPHPEGAVAFLFEDISASIASRRQFRSETELNHSALDNLPSALAIFEASGTLYKVNTAFLELWQVEGSSLLEADFIDLIQVWKPACLPTPVWGDLKDFFEVPGGRAEWGAEIALVSHNEKLFARFTPLAAGATLCSFERSASS